MVRGPAVGLVAHGSGRWLVTDEHGWWRPVTDAQMCVLAGATVIGVWSMQRCWLLLSAGAVIIVVLRLVDVRVRRDLVLAALVLLALGGLLSARSWAAAQPRTSGRA
jgi:hypothetical protein